MGRGKDKRILGSDIPNMSRRELNNALVKAVRITGTAVVRSRSSGNARYEDPSQAGRYNEDKL